MPTPVQPQGTVTIDRSNKFGASAIALFLATSNKNLADDTVLGVSGPTAQVTTPYGVAEAFRQDHFLETSPTAAIGTQPFVEFWMGVPDAAYGTKANSNSAHKFLTGSSTNQIGIFQNGPDSAQWGTINNWPTNYYSGEVVPQGSLQILIIVQRAASIDFYRNGALIVSKPIGPYNQPASSMILGAFIGDITNWSTSSDTIMAGRFLANWTTAEVAEFSNNPYQAVKSPQPPATMAAPTATAQTSSASIAFTPVAGATGYRITPFVGTIAQAAVNSTTLTSPIVVSGLSSSNAYTFKIAATNAVGTGVDSPASNAVTPLAAPAVTVTSVTVTPATATSSQQFAASVAGANGPSQNVTWTALLGSIDSNGFYTPPTQTTAEQKDTVKARSVQDPNQTGIATITIPASTSSSPVTPGLTFDSGLASLLFAQATKADWATTLKTALGPVRRVRCFRDANAAAPNPSVTGVEFLNFLTDGELGVNSGNIISFGVAKNSLIHKPADLSTGIAVLRIEGNGHWVQGTVGLTAADNFVFSANPTAVSGIAFTKEASVLAPSKLRSGTGPAAPPDDVDRPVGFRVITNPAAPTVSPICYANVRDPDIVPDHPSLARDMGDIRVHRVADGGGLVIGTGGDCFRWAMTVLGTNGSVNAEIPGKTVWHAIVECVPHGRFASYPFRKDFNIANDTLSPQAFKIELLRANGTVIDVFEMFSTRDANNTPGSGKFINGPNQNSDTGSDTVRPFQPWWTCRMALIYKSHMTTMNRHAKHFCPGVVPEVMRGTSVSAFDATATFWKNYQPFYAENGLGTWHIAPKWSRPRGAGFDTTILDPSRNVAQMRRENDITQAMGYGYEPGSAGTRRRYMGSGGSCHDRGPWPHAIVAYMTDPTGKRPHGAVPYNVLMEEWCKNNGNEGMNHLTNLERGVSLPKKNVLGIEPVCYNDTYYSGGNEDYVPDIPNHAIRLLAPLNGAGETVFDKNGRSFVVGESRDALHNYHNASSGAYLKNDAAAMILGKRSFDSNVLCAFGFTQGGFFWPDWLTRNHAWVMKNFAEMWTITSNDPRSLTRNELETMWQRHLEATHDAMRPIVENQTSLQGLSIRNFGYTMVDALNGGNNVPLDQRADAPGNHAVNFNHDAKSFYFGLPLMFMKQTGSWATMRARSPKCAWTLDAIVTALSRASVDFFVDGKGRGEYCGYTWTQGATTGNAAAPQTWNDISPLGVTVDGSQRKDWIHAMDGTIRGYIEINNTQHYRAQFVWLLRDFFPERAFPRLAEAITLLDGWYGEVSSNVAAHLAASQPPEYAPEWHWRFAMMGKFKPADTIGAPV